MTDSTLNRFVASGTNAERIAFTPSPPTPASGPDPSYVWIETDTDNAYMWDFDGSAWIQIGGGSAVTNLSTSLSQVSSSLSGAISVNTGQSTSLSQISSSLSGAISSTSSLSTAISTVDANQSGSISTNLSKINSLSTALGGGGGWTELDYYDGTTSIISRVIDVSAYNDVKVTFSAVTTLSGALRAVLVSVDGGSTYFNTSGNYVEIAATGVTTNDAAFFAHGTSATAARSGTITIHGLRGSRAQKQADTPSYVTTEMFFTASATAIDHIKVLALSPPTTAISITGGTIQVEAR